MKPFYKILLVFIALSISGCSLVTKFEVYKLNPEDKTHIALKEDDVEVDLYLDASEKKRIVFPLIYQKTLYKEPYRIFVSVIGNIDGLEPLEIRYSVNKRPYNILKQDQIDWKKSKRKDGLSRYITEVNYLNYSWKNIQEVKIEFEFYGTKDGIKTKYLAKKIFKPEFKKAIGLHFTETYL